MEESFLSSTASLSPDENEEDLPVVCFVHFLLVSVVKCTYPFV